MKFKFKFSALILIFCVLFLSGCTQSHKDAYIYFELPSTPSTLDPQTAQTDSELLIVRNIFEGLMRKNADGKIVCAAAESYEKHGLTYIFKLKDNLKWSNSERLTAYDFEFAFKRAVSPKTKAPFASRLFCIKGAEEIYNSTAKLDSLGVSATNENTLKITLKEENPDFLETLTSSICMPCNQDFFNSSEGKYGLFKEHIIGNGSYKLSKWNKEVFGIRLYSYDYYNGDFEPENSAVFLTCNKKENVVDKLLKNSIDLAFIDCANANDLKEKGFGTIEYQNICWTLTISNEFSPDMRKALSLLIGGEVFSKSLPHGYSIATSIYPNEIADNVSVEGMNVYDLKTGQNLYATEVEKLENKKFPSNVILYYYNDGHIKHTVTDIVGHWQNNLSAFVNIESASESELLLPQLKEQTYSMAFFPVKANSPNISEYLNSFGIDYNGESLTEIQKQILKSNNIIPIANQATAIAYSPALSNLFTELGNGYIDFAYIIKSE